MHVSQNRTGLRMILVSPVFYHGWFFPHQAGKGSCIKSAISGKNVRHIFYSYAMIDQPLCLILPFALAPCRKIAYTIQCHSKLVCEFCNLLWKPLFDLYLRDIIREFHCGQRCCFSIHIGNIQFLLMADRLTWCVFRNNRPQIKDKELTLTCHQDPV